MQKERKKMKISQRLKSCDWLINSKNITELIKCHNLLLGSMYTLTLPFFV